MRDDAGSEALALQALEQSGWSLWCTCKREGAIYGAKTPTELLKLINHKQPKEGMHAT
jgi:hypothetical protein